MHFRFFVGLSLCAIAGCQGVDPRAPAADADPTSLTGMSPDRVTVVHGNSVEFTTSFGDEPDPLPALIWSLSGEGCSGDECGTIQSTGPTTAIYTAPSMVPSPHSVRVRAALSTNPESWVGATVNVAQVELTIEVSPTSVLMGGGGSREFIAIVEGDPANAGVRWIAFASEAGRAGTISPNPSASGQPVTFTASTGLSPGMHVSLVAYSVTDPAWFAIASISIGP